MRFETLFGGHKAVVRPVPIPNTAVKHSLADGSGLIDSARVGRRQSFLKSRSAKCVPAFLLSPFAGIGGQLVRVERRGQDARDSWRIGEQAG